MFQRSGEITAFSGTNILTQFKLLDIPRIDECEGTSQLARVALHVDAAAASSIRGLFVCVQGGAENGMVVAWQAVTFAVPTSGSVRTALAGSSGDYVMVGQAADGRDFVDLAGGDSKCKWYFGLPDAAPAGVTTAELFYCVTGLE